MKKEISSIAVVLGREVNTYIVGENNVGKIEDTSMMYISKGKPLPNRIGGGYGVTEDKISFTDSCTVYDKNDEVIVVVRNCPIVIYYKE